MSKSPEEVTRQTPEQRLTPPRLSESSDGWPPLPQALKPWSEYSQDAMAALVLIHEIARDPNQQYSEAARKAKAFLSKFNLWLDI